MMFTCYRNAAGALVEVLAQLEEENNKGPVDIFMEPPEEDGSITDQDSDKSDDEYECNVNHLGRKLLAAKCEVKMKHNEDLSENNQDDWEPFAKKSKPARKTNPTWKKKKTTHVISEIFQHPRAADRSELNTPLDFFLFSLMMKFKITLQHRQIFMPAKIM